MARTRKGRVPGAFELACRCGQVALGVDVPGRGAASRVLCYCDDCQTAARALEAQDDVLGPGSGTDIVQTTPDRVTVLRGAQHLAALRLSPKGLLRWYASCCDTPLCNSLPNLKLGFVGVVIRPGQSAQVDAVLGSPRAHIFTTTARPRAEAPGKDVGFAATGMAVLVRLIAAAASGRAKDSPFRDAQGNPVGPVKVLTKEERFEARPG
jgi:hypothetical protein